METIPVMRALLIQHELHTILFRNVIESVTDEHANTRINEANHIAWLTGNLVSLRYKLVNAMGISIEQKFPSLFKNNKGIQNGITYPSLQELQEDWNNISPVLKERLCHATPEALNGVQPFPMPAITDNTFFASLCFLLHREAYGIGQIALLRRVFGYEAMSYKIN